MRIRARLRNTLLPLAVLAAGVSPVAAATLDEAVRAAERGDYATALQISKPLAEQGDAGAQGLLGAMYANGRGLPQDDRQAAKWYRLAAEQGDAGAQGLLGAMYRNGRGVPKDCEQAAEWYRLAAEQGHALGQMGLGGMYRFGRGVPADYVQAHMWLDLAAAQGFDRAVEERDRVAGKMTAAQIADAERLARKWQEDR